MKKIFSFFLCMLSLFVLLVSCVDENKPTDLKSTEKNESSEITKEIDTENEETDTLQDKWTNNY